MEQVESLEIQLVEHSECRGRSRERLVERYERRCAELDCKPDTPGREKLDAILWIMDGLTRHYHRPDLFEVAQRLQFVGEQMQDREQWLARLLKRFAELKAKAAAKTVKEQLAAATDEQQAVELLRKLQQTQPPKRSAG